MTLFLILGILLAIQSLVSLRDGFRFLRYVRRSLKAKPGDYTPAAAVILPCKGLDEGFDLNIASFMSQEYPRYQLIFALASEGDSAWSRLKELICVKSTEGSPPLPKMELVVAPGSESRAEKITNLLHGLKRVLPETEVLVFADADCRPKPGWLRSLVAPLADPSTTDSTGFRWYLPGHTFASRLRAAWDTSVATMLGDHDHNIAWGGSMAIRLADFRRLRVAEDYWAHTASDDYALTRAVREAGGHIRFEPRCLVASREESTLGEFFAWANRQIILTRVYEPRLWAMGLSSLLLYCTTMLLGAALIILPSSCLLIRGTAASVLGIILALGIAKGRIRTIVAREVFPEEAGSLARYSSCYWQLAPLVPRVMLANFIVAGLTRRIEWRGVHYELRSRDEVRVIRRDSSVEQTSRR